MNTFRKVMTSAAVATLLVASASSFAQVDVRTINITANGNDVTTVASGRDAKARSRVGVVSGNVKGNRIDITANNNEVTTRASGRGSEACSAVGTVQGGSSGGLFGGLFGGGGESC